MNPYPKDSISYQIYENNHIDPGILMKEADNIDKIIIYLYVMGHTLKEISATVGFSTTTISNKLNKYGIK